MYIYIDEAGVFNIPSHRKWSISCVGALVIPKDVLDELFLTFEALKLRWGFKNKEVKGSRLNEAEVSSLVNLLKKFDIIFQVVAIDTITQSHSGIIKHKNLQADKLTKNLTNEHHPDLVKEFEKLKDQLESLSNPLYLQTICTIELLYTVLQKSTLYYVQRKPKELSKFYWIIDAKNNKITSYEKLWTTILLPLIQTKSLQEPLDQLIGADYSYFKKYLKQTDSTPEYLKNVTEDAKPFIYIESNNIYNTHRKFEQSHNNLGLQIVDILTTGIRRAMNGNLQIQGWRHIGSLMVQSKKPKNAISVLDLCNIEKPKYNKGKPPYWSVSPITNRYAKNILLE